MALPSVVPPPPHQRPARSPGALRDVAHTPIPVQPRRGPRVAPLILLLGLFVFAVIAIVYLANSLRQAAGETLAGLAASGVPPISVPPVEDPTTARGGKGGTLIDPSSLFRERESRTRTPTIVLSTEDEGTVTLELRAENGKQYSLSAESGSERRLQVPPGHYTIRVTHSRPGVNPSFGDATFRQFKEYDATFVIQLDDGKPIHLGD